MQKKSLLVAFLLSLWTLYAQAQTTVTHSVVHSSDDAWEQNNGDMNITQDDVQLGKEGYAAFRFQYVAIPAGATITSAHVEFIAKDDKNDTPSGVIIKGELNAYPNTLLNPDFNISVRTMTSGAVPWTFGDWIKDESYSSPDLATVIQEIVNQALWNAGNPMVLILDATGSKERKAYSFDKNPLLAPRLIVTYTGGNPPGDMSDHVDTDMDLSATNEIQDLELTANILSLTGDTTPVDLSAFLDNTDTQDLSIDGTGKIISLTDGGSVTINTDDADSDPSNEYNTMVTLTGTDLNITDNGGTITTDLSSLDQSAAVATAQNTADQAINDAAQAQLSADNALAAAGQAQNDISSHIADDLDTDATNEYNTSAVLNGTDLEITDGGGTKTVDLSSLANLPETDPEFNASPAAGITNGDVSNWNEAHGWGDHSAAGYLTTENDPKVGSLTNNTVPRWDGTQLQDGIIKDNGSNIGIGALPDPAYLINATGGDVKFEISDFGNFDIPTYAGVMKIYNKYNPTQYAVLRGNSGGPTYRAELELASETGNLILRSPQANSTDLSKIEATGDLSILADNVGIGTTTPDAKLHVEGGSIKMVDGTQAAGRVLTSDANGLASWQDIVDNVDDADHDPTNEYNTSAVLNGTDLAITDGGGTKTVDLSSLANVPETDPKVASSIVNNVPVWNGISLNDGSIFDNGNNVQMIFGGNPALTVTEKGRLNIDGSFDVYVGGAAGANSNYLGHPYEANTGIGYGALMNNTSALNVAVGSMALSSNTIGERNTGLGTKSLFANNGSNNVAVGSEAMVGNNTGGANVAVGARTMWSNTTGNSNTALGIEAMWSNGDGSNNTAVGELALGTNLDGSYNTAIGSRADVSQPGLTNATAVGANAIAGASNTVILGNNANVGIGTSTPEAKLHIEGSIKMVDGNQAAGRVLTSDADGLASWQDIVDNVDDADHDPSNEIQTLSLSGNDLTISGAGGNTITLPTTPETDPEVGANTINRIPVWNGTALVEGTILSDNNTVSATGSAFGINNQATSLNSVAFGYQNTANAEYSMAVGSESVASGNGSTAIGLGAQAIGNASLALGLGAQATGNAAMTLGTDVQATGDYSLAIGRFSRASGGSAIAMGYFTQSTGEASTSLGRQTDSWGQGSTAMGWFTGAGGLGATAMGNNTRAYADNSTAMGAYATATGQSATAIGNWTQAAALASTAIGQYNVGAGNGGSWVETDPIFEIGIGADNENRSNAITVLKNGNTGIGTFSPEAKLHVAGGSFKLVDGTQAAGSVLTSDADGLASWQALADNDPENEYNTSAILNGTDLEITDGGGTKIVDLSSLANVAEVDPKVGTLSANKVPHWNGFALQDGLIEDDGNHISITNDAFINGALVGRGGGNNASNTAFGPSTLANNSTGNNNAAVGYLALSNNTSGEWNTAVGSKTLQNNEIGWGNTGMGFVSLTANTTGSMNTAIGTGTMQFNTEGSQNTAIGMAALNQNTSGYLNIAIGEGSMANNLTGFRNAAVGSKAMSQNTTGGENVAMGDFTMHENTTGGANTGIGEQALYYNTTGSANTAIGNSSMFGNVTGNFNTALGQYADVLSPDLTNATALGYNAKVGSSNSLVLGSTNVNVGIGNSSPDQKLHITGGTIRIENITENNATCRALYVDENGVVFYKDECAIPFSNPNSDLLLNEIKKRDEKISELEDMLTKLSRQVSMLVDERSLQSETLDNPDRAWIEQNMPNPFLHETRISYYIPANSKQAQIIFYDIHGKVIKVTEIKETGKGILTVTAGTLSTGTYFYKLVVDNQDIDTKKAVFTN